MLRITQQSTGRVGHVSQASQCESRTQQGRDFFMARFDQRCLKDIGALAAGTVVATFDDNGRYGSRKDGTSHAAIFLRKNAIGIVVLDQWVTNGVRQVVHERTIRFGNKAGKKINNGDAYYVVD